MNHSLNQTCQVYEVSYYYRIASSNAVQPTFYAGFTQGSTSYEGSRNENSLPLPSRVNACGRRTSTGVGPVLF